MAKLPFDITKSVRALREAAADAEESMTVLLTGDEALVGLAQERFAGDGTTPATAPLDALFGPAGLAAGVGELVVVLTTPAQEADVRAMLAGAGAGDPVIVAVDEGPGTHTKATRLPNGVVRLAFSDSDSGWDRLFSLCAEVAGERGIALGRRYPPIRRAAAHRLISRVAMQNVFIALVFFMPGADMPAMTLNQARMILNLAAMYGQKIDQERALELTAVVALGFGFRGVGRLLARSIPGLAIPMRMATAYSATMAVGLGAMKYFEEGAPASTSKVVALAGSLRH